MTSVLFLLLAGVSLHVLAQGRGLEQSATTPVGGDAAFEAQSPSTPNSSFLKTAATNAAATLGNPPSISAFTALPAKLSPGQSGTLSWSVKGATGLSINAGVGPVTGTSVVVKPTSTTSYTLTATNSRGSATAAVTVTVGSAPTITSFTASPMKVPPGQAVTLSWAVTGSPGLIINPGVGAVSGTAVVVKPTATTTYILTATNAFGTATASVTVLAGSAPSITSFAATPAKVVAGQSSALSWATKGAATLTIGPGVGAVTGSSVFVKPGATTLYTLTASNAFGSATATLTVTVGGAPVITSFTAAPAKLAAGQSSTLSWTVTGTATLSISPAVGVVAGNSVVVKPAATTTYTLTATNDAGSTTAALTLTLGSAPTISGFTATPANIAPGQVSTLSWAVSGAPTLTMSPSLGAISGAPVKVTPSATTTYTLTAANSFGSVSASVTVRVGSPPQITSLTAAPVKVTPGQSSTLSWIVTGSPTLSINSGVGDVTGNSVKVSPTATTTYTLSATNSFGSTTASVTVMTGSAPTIGGFTATPATLTPGQSTTLSWTVTGSPGLIVNPAVGAVNGTSVKVTPSATTTYILTAKNSFGTATATTTATVQASSPPLIGGFSANPTNAGPGISSTLRWTITGATSVSIDHGVGTVTGNSVTVNPTAATTYTLTATNSAGSVTASTKVAYIPLTRVTAQLYHTEHAVFIIPGPSQVTWTGANSLGSVYSTANINDYVSILKSVFPSDYFFVVVAANNLTPSNVPNVLTYRRLADGIGETTIRGVGIPNICRYHIGTGTVIDGAFGVLDHEIGHNWGVFIGTEVGSGHWLANSTATGQLASTYTDDGYATVKQIAGDPVNGFSWAAVENIRKNETEAFSDQDLYLQGFGATFPDLYVLTSPVYHPDHSVTYSAVVKYDQAWVEQHNGLRNPSYRTSDKRLRVGFVYVARDLAEIQASYQPIERSINEFVNAEQIDTSNFRFQVPFLVETLYRASLDALLTDLDGNRTPTLTIAGATNLVSSDGSATVPFQAADPDGPAPTVSCVPTANSCAINGNSVVLTGLAPGAHFFTIKAQDAGGKKVFAHFVVDVQ